MTADDLLARIDSTTEQWDTWDGRSADAARWVPPAAIGVQIRVIGADAFTEALTGAVARLAGLLRPAVEAMAEIEQAQQQRAKHQPPMWAVQPNRERRR